MAGRLLARHPSNTACQRAARLRSCRRRTPATCRQGRAGPRLVLERIRFIPAGCRRNAVIAVHNRGAGAVNVRADNFRANTSRRSCAGFGSMRHLAMVHRLCDAGGEGCRFRGRRTVQALIAVLPIFIAHPRKSRVADGSTLLEEREKGSQRTRGRRRGFPICCVLHGRIKYDAQAFGEVIGAGVANTWNYARLGTDGP